MFKKLLVCVVILLMCIFVLCGYGEEKLQDLIVLTGTDAENFDPHKYTGTPTEVIIKNIYSNLVRFDSNLEIVPDLAESWEMSADALTWTFNLRQNVKFHDGTPFNAEAVKVSFERVLNPDTGSPRRSVVEIISGVEVVDDNTVKIKTASPCSVLLNKLAHPAAAIISPAAIEKYGKDLATNPVGTGPFIFNEWKVGEELILDRNPDYFDGAPQVSKLIFRVVPDDSTRSLLLESGRADIAMRLPVTELNRLKDNDEVKAITTDTVMTMYVALNNSKGPLKDMRVRQAMNYAIDKDVIIRDILDGMGTIADAPISPYTWGYSPTGTYEYNVEKAKTLLAEAGYPNGIELELWFSPGRYLMDTKVCENLQYQWGKVGINIKLRQWEWLAFRSEIQKGQFDMLLLGWSPSTAEADQGLYPVFHSSQFPPASNRAYYNNAQVDKLLVEAKTEKEPDKCKELYRQAQKIIVDEAPWLFLYYVKQIVVCRSNISGLEVLPLEHIYFSKVIKK